MGTDLLHALEAALEVTNGVFCQFRQARHCHQSPHEQALLLADWCEASERVARLLALESEQENLYPFTR